MPDPVAILTFHHVLPEKDTLTIPPELFEALILFLKDHYNIISYQTFIEHLFDNKRLPGRSVLLTFDDGYLDNYLYAYPVLARHQVPAVIFAVTGQIRASDDCRTSLPFTLSHRELNRKPKPELFLNTAEIKAMESSGLVTIESHTRSHLVCSHQPYETVARELSDSFTFIKEHTTPRDRYGFCWPKGAYDDVALEAFSDSPYTFAFSTTEGAYHTGDDLRTIRRIDCSSWNGNQEEYLGRLRRKLRIYTTPLLSQWYSSFREYRIRQKRAWKRR